MATGGLQESDYAKLLRYRTALRRFLRWSEEQAQAAGLTASQHQLLLAIKGHDEPSGPTVGDVADYLALRHNSTVELVDRAERGGYVERRRDHDDQRVIRLRLTQLGESQIRELSRAHLDELRRLDELNPPVE
jgi:DNA-binding MarR family transcriptional regulator